MPLATVIIPVASYHVDTFPRAVESVQYQTIETNVKVVIDRDNRGAGWARNEGVKGVDTPFVIFLDADDELAPQFVQACARAYQTGRYVYTDWLTAKTPESRQMPNICPDQDHDYNTHLITTLFPTALFNAIGGFDEKLQGHEDVDFYLKCAQNKICGDYLPEALIYYTGEGQRSVAFNARSDKKAIMDRVYLAHGGSATIMACCGGEGKQALVNPGEAQIGDVQAQANWMGMQTVYSSTTGRLYTGGNGAILNVAPADLAALVNTNGTPRFIEVPVTKGLAPEREQVLKASGLL